MDTINTWTVYHGTSDFGDQYVARRFEKITPTKDHFANKSLEKVRDWVFENSLKYNQGEPFLLSRLPGDDPTIVEVWI